MKAHEFSPPPAGDQSQGWALLSVCWAFVAAAVVTTLLRVWVRVRLTRNLGWDDYTMIAAIVRISQFRTSQTSSGAGISLSIKLDSDNHPHWRRSHYLRSHPWRFRPPQLLLAAISKALLCSHWLGRLDPDIHHLDADQDQHLSILATNRRFKGDSTCNILARWILGTGHDYMYCVILGHLPATERLLGHWCRRDLFERRAD
jgi:hypothetical protein